MSDIAQRGDQVQTGAGPARAAGKRQRQLARWAGAGALAGLAWCVAWPAAASGAYPSKPVTLIVPYTAGGSTDLVARIVAQKLTERLGQAFIVDNKPGANAVIGMDAAARATPDGYTLLMNTAGGQTLSPVLYKTKFHAIDSWEPISLITTIPMVIVAREGGAKDWADLVKRARVGNPPLSASSGSSLVVLMTDAMKAEIGAPTLMNIQYKGTAMQAQAVVKGEVDFSVDSFVTMPHIKAGKVKALAVMADKRVDSLPNVPTLHELGVKNMDFGSWSALLAPKGTPQAVVDLLAKEVQAIAKLPDVQEKFKGFEHVPVGSTPQQLAKTMQADLNRWTQLVKTTGYKPEN